MYLQKRTSKSNHNFSYCYYYGFFSNKEILDFMGVVFITGVKVDAEGDLTTRLKENLIPIKTTQAGNGFEDLMPLKEILKDKKIIGMGEATHGTKEFFEMKHRMFEFLVEELAATFTYNKDEYIRRSSQEEYDLMIQHITVMNQWINYIKKVPRSFNESFRGVFNIRDKSMAQNVKWILDYEEKYYGNNKIMLWGHNGHIGRYYFGLPIMGNNLSEMYGNEYYSLGFDFYQGSFRSIPMDIFNKVVKGRPQKFYIESSPHNSYGYEMEKTGVPISYLDFKNASRDEDMLKFLSYEINMNTIGAAYTGSWFASDYLAKLAPNKVYDGVIFIKTTNASNEPSYQ